MRFVKVLRNMLRSQAIRAEIVKAATRSSSTTSTTTNPALQIQAMRRGHDNSTALGVTQAVVTLFASVQIAAHKKTQSEALKRLQ